MITNWDLHLHVISSSSHCTCPLAVSPWSLLPWWAQWPQLGQLAGQLEGKVRSVVTMTCTHIQLVPDNLVTMTCTVSIRQSCYDDLYSPTVSIRQSCYNNLYSPKVSIRQSLLLSDSDKISQIAILIHTQVKISTHKSTSRTQIHKQGTRPTFRNILI